MRTVICILLATLVLSGCEGLQVVLPHILTALPNPGTNSLRAGDKVSIGPGQVLIFGELKVTDNHKERGFEIYKADEIHISQLSGSTEPRISTNLDVLRSCSERLGCSTEPRISTNPDGRFYSVIPAGEYKLGYFTFNGNSLRLSLGVKMMEPGKAYYAGKIVIDLSMSPRAINQLIADYINSVEVQDDFEAQKSELLSIAPSLKYEDVKKSLFVDYPDLANKVCLRLHWLIPGSLCGEEPRGKIAIAAEGFGAEKVEGTKTSARAAKEGTATGALGGAVAGTAVGAGVAGATIASAGIYAPVPALWPFVIAGAALGAAAGGSSGAEKGISKEDLAVIQKAYDHAMFRAKGLEPVSLRVERKAKQAGREVQHIEGLSTNQFGMDNSDQLLKSSASDALLNLTIKAVGMKVRRDRLPQMPLEIQLQSEVVWPNYERKKFMLYFLSEAHTIQEWSADDGKLLLDAMEEGFEKLSDKAMRQYFWSHRESP